MKKFFWNILPYFIPLSKTRKKIKRRNHVGYTFVVVENGKERPVKYGELSNIIVLGKKKDNLVKVELPQTRKSKILISFEGEHNQVIIGSQISGKWIIACHEHDNLAQIGKNADAVDVTINLISNQLFIGDNQMFSDNIRIWGDGHSVLDYKTKQVINKPTKPIIIGNHCWIGERVTLTKNAQIPDDCIVGIASVVTKAFTEEHCLIAGSPAKVCKTGISWHGFPPLAYEDYYVNSLSHDKTA